MARKKKVYGKCHICGVNSNLTQEHIPPKSAFNTGRVELLSPKSILNNGSELKKSFQNGLYKNSLCKTCNNNTGLWYGNAYKGWVNQIYPIAINNDIEKGIAPENQISLYPLRVLKQILSMFTSINTPKAYPSYREEIENFLLNRENQFLPNKIKVYFYIVSSKSRYNRQVPISGVLKGGASPIILSEISWFPCGYILTDSEETPNFDKNLIDITFFKNYSYDEKASLDLLIPVMPINFYMCGDFRTKKEIEKLKQN